MLSSSETSVQITNALEKLIDSAELAITQKTIAYATTLCNTFMLLLEKCFINVIINTP